MADKEKKDQPGKESPGATNDELIDQESENLDQTRMDIDVNQTTLSEETGTDIHIDPGKEITDNGKVGNRFKFLSDFLKKLPQIFKSKGKNLKKPTQTRQVSLSPLFLSLVNLWIAAPEKSLPHKLLFYLSRLAILTAGTLLLYLLGLSVFDSLDSDHYFKWFVLGVGVVALVLSLTSLFLRLHPCWFVGIPFVAILSLFIWHVVQFQTTDPTFYSFVHRAPAFVFNEIWLSIFLLEALLLLVVYPRFLPLIIFFLILCLYSLTGFVFNLIKGVPLEASWEGVGFLSSIPLVILQPTFFALHLVVPFLFLASLVCLLFFRKDVRGTQWVVLNIVILFLAGGLGLADLQKSRIPNILNLFMEAPLGLGSAEFESKGHLFSLKTVNYISENNPDGLEHYRLALVSKTVNQANQQKFYLNALSISGFPVFYLTKNEFWLTVDGKAASKWKITPLGKKARPNKKITKDIEPRYLLTVEVPPLGPKFEIDLPERGAEFSKNQLLDFSVSRKGSSIASYDIVVDGKSVLKDDDLRGRTSFMFPLSELGEGKHFVEITLTDQNGLSATQSQEITVLPPLSVTIESPMNGDYFGDQLSVFVRIKGPAGVKVSSVGFLIDGQEFLNKNSPPYMGIFDTSELEGGKHQLRIVAQTESGEIKSEVDLYKGDYPKISFVSPSLGQFLIVQTPVEVKQSPEGNYRELELYLDNKLLHQWNEPPYKYSWNTSELSSGTHLLKVKGKTKEGVQSSDSVRVSTGKGGIKIVPPGSSPKSGFQYKKVVFVLDASVSQWDSWNLKSKWDWSKELFRFKEISSQLKGTKVGVVVAGGGVPFNHQDCSDANWAFKLDSFAARKITKVLDQTKPTGVSALFSGIELALKAKPQKIIVLTDSADSCNQKIPSKLVKKLSQSNVHLDLVSLGSIDQKNAEVLEELAQIGSGNFIVVEKVSEFEEKLAKILTLYYEILSGDQVILAAPVDGKERFLRPGEYSLKITMDPPLTGQKITIRNGLTTDVGLQVEGNQTKIKESFNAIKTR